MILCLIAVGNYDLKDTLLKTFFIFFNHKNIIFIYKLKNPN